MKLRTLRKRTTATVSLGIVGAAAASVLVASPAQAATTYWSFKSLSYNTCLTAGQTGTAFAATCNGSSYQQWDFVGTDPSGYNQLKNRATGQCLATDDKTSVNAVWTSTCSWVDGQRFHYQGDSGAFTSYYSTILRAESDGAVYAGSQLAYWDGWHN